MLTELHRFMQTYLMTDGYFKSTKGVLIACSGGVDSLSLLHGLLSFLNQYADQHSDHLVPKLWVLYTDHGLRENAMEKDTPGIMALQKLRSFEFIRERVEITEGSDKGHSIEMRARDARHQCIQKTVENHGLQGCFFGHHANDVTETLFLQLMRGTKSQLTGIREISVQNGCTYYRPFVSLPKKILESYALEHQLQVSEDVTNQSDTFLRNRLRHQLIPPLETLFPNCHEKFAEYLHYTDEVRIFLMSLIEHLLPDIKNVSTEWIVDKAPLKKLPSFLQRFWAQALLKLCYQQGYTQAHVLQVLHAINATEFVRMPVPEGWSIFADRERLLVSKENAIHREYCYSLSSLTESVLIKELDMRVSFSHLIEKGYPVQGAYQIRPYTSAYHSEQLLSISDSCEKAFKRNQVSKIMKTRFPVLSLENELIAIADIWEYKSAVLESK